MRKGAVSASIVSSNKRGYAERVGFYSRGRGGVLQRTRSPPHIEQLQSVPKNWPSVGRWIAT